MAPRSSSAGSIHRQVALLRRLGQRSGRCISAVARRRDRACLVDRRTDARRSCPPRRASTKLAFAAAYGVAIWCWSFAVIGLAMRFLSRENARVRYVADASYWIYLVHLPVVVAFQVVVGHLPLHWTREVPARCSSRASRCCS